MPSGGTIGNKARTGMPRPPGSGVPNVPGGVTNFTFRVRVNELKQWRTLAAEMHVSVGSLVRNAVREYIEDLTNG